MDGAPQAVEVLERNGNGKNNDKKLQQIPFGDDNQKDNGNNKSKCKCGCFGWE